MANLELTDSIIGVLGKNETEKTVAQILTILKNRGDIEGSGLRSEVSITGFNFGESNTVSVGTTEETKTTTLTANFISPEIEGAYYVLIEGKKYPISKINGRIKIDKTEIQSNDNTSAKISNVVSNDTDIATVKKTGDKQITITGKARGNTTITVQSTGLPDVTLNVNVKGSTTLTINTDNTANCSVSPTSVTKLEGEEVTLTATPASGKKLKGWYINNELKSTDNPYKYKIPDGTNGTTYATSITITAQFEDRTSEIEEGRTDRVEYGKYVNYNIDLGIGTENDVTDDWKVFYDDGTNIYIIASDYVPTVNSYLSVAMTNMGAITTEKSQYPYSVYWGSTPTFQTYKTATTPTAANGSADIFINRPIGTASLDEKGMLGFWKAKTTSNSNKNAKMVACLMDTKVWEGFAGGLPEGMIGNAYAIGSPTLSMWIESWNAMYPNDKLYYRVESMNGWGYIVSDQMNFPFDNYGVSLSNKEGYNNLLYYPHHEEFSRCLGYWLSSNTSESNSKCMPVDYHGYIGYDKNDLNCYYSTYRAVRPVVCLPAGIGLKTNTINSNLYEITNNEWD